LVRASPLHRLAWLAVLGVCTVLGCPAAAPQAATPADTAPAASAPIGKDLPPSSSAAVVAGLMLQFPRDYGAHPQFGIEWWYLTGWLSTGAQRQPLGFQITFFRVRTGLDEANPSTFTPRQLLIAHAAISDPTRGRLWQDQRIRRAGLGLAQAAVGDTSVWMDDWRLQRRDDSDPARHGDVYLVQVSADGFGFDLTASADSPPMLNGNAGFSQKGPMPRSASYYYSQPHLRVHGSVTRDGHRETVTGEGWLDHEWASQYLDPAASGWDWAGVNLADGSAVMAFEIRDRNGRPYWAAGTRRDALGHTQTFGPDDVAFTPTRRWRSPRTGVLYPVAEQIRIGTQLLQLEPLLDDQEFDARLSSGAIYWEGAVSVSAAQRPVGRGYLELTGYGRPLSLR
jgi:predicted secreted hydrolase